METQWPNGCDTFVVDHYGLDANYERAVRPWARRIVAIDDLANRPHDCDILLDQTAGRLAADYQGLVPADAQILTGARHALLRQEFAVSREATLAERMKRTGLKNLLVSLGGTDPHNVVEIVLDGIEASGLALQVDLILGSATRNIDRIVARVAGRSDVTVTMDAADMAQRMAKANLAIGTAGTTSWERCCLGLPTLMIVVADNQTRIAHSLEEAGAAVILGDLSSIDATNVATSLNRLSRAPQALRDMSRRAAEITDGLGAGRVADLVLRMASQ